MASKSPKKSSSNIILTLGCSPSPSEPLNNVLEGKTSKLDYDQHWTQIWTTSRREEKYTESNTSTIKTNILKYNDVKMLKQIGEGGQALIYEGICNNKKIAIKIYKAHNLQYNVWPNKFFQLQKNSICCPLFPIIMDNGSYSLAMELYASDLRKILDKQLKGHKEDGCLSAPPFNNMVTMDLILQIAMGMENLHNANFVHHDLKAANVLILNEEPFYDGTFVVGICDFEENCIGGTNFWRAPEIIQELENTIHLPIDERKTLPFTREADVYSFGMVCYEIVSGKIPFQEQQKLPIDIVLSGNRPELPMDINKKFKSLIWKCWDGNPKARPTFVTIVSELMDLIAETKDLECILQKSNFVSSKDMCKLLLEIEKFEEELKILHTINDEKVIQVGNEFIKSIRIYLTHYESKKAFLDQPLNEEKHEFYEKTLTLYEDCFKICKEFHDQCCVRSGNEHINHKHSLFLNLSSKIAYHLP